MSNENNQIDIDSRLGSVEQDVSGIKTDIKYIRTSLDTLSKKTETNFGTLAAWAGVILTVVVFYNEISSKPNDIFITEQKSRNNRLWDAINNQRDSNSTKDDIANIKKDLQKEIEFVREILESNMKRIELDTSKSYTKR